MTLMQFENKVSVGNILTIVSMIVVALGIFSQFQTELTRQADRIGNVEAFVRDFNAANNTEQVGNEQRLRGLEVAQASISSNIINIQTGIADIKSSLVTLTEKVSK